MCHPWKSGSWFLRNSGSFRGIVWHPIHKGSNILQWTSLDQGCTLVHLEIEAEMLLKASLRLTNSVHQWCVLSCWQSLLSCYPAIDLGVLPWLLSDTCHPQHLSTVGKVIFTLQTSQLRILLFAVGIGCHYWTFWEQNANHRSEGL